MTAEKPARRRIPPRLAGGALALALAVGAGFFFIRNEAPPSGATGAPQQANNGPRAFGGQPAGAVTMERVQIEPLEQNLTAIGTGRAVQSVMLNAEVSGIIRRVVNTPGALVEEGFVLVELESEQQRIAVAKARADYAIARTNAQRFQGLVADNAASALEYESAQNTLTAAQAELRRAEFELSQRTVRAPFAGVVGITNLNIGDFLTVGAPIATIDDVTSLLVDFVIPETASTYVREGLEVTATAAASGGRVFEGAIRAVDSRIDPASRTRRVEAMLSNEDMSLVPGATFTINLAVPGRQAFSVPGLAVLWDRAGSYVWKRSPNGVAQRVPVTILQRTSQAILVEGPLLETDYVVAEGADLVRPGAPLPDPQPRSGVGLSSANGAASN